MKDSIRMLIAIMLIGLMIVFYLVRKLLKGKALTTKIITRVAIFGAISAVLYIVPYFKFAVPFFPSFLEIHFDEVPALISGFAYGPLVGFLVILVKTLIKLPFTSTLCVGEIADFAYGSILVVVSAIFYKKKHSIVGALVGLGVAMGIQLAVSGFFTTFVLLDFYIMVMGFPKQAIIAMCQACNSSLRGLGWDFFFMICLPFNAFKDVILFVLTFILYKQTHKVIDKISFAE